MDFYLTAPDGGRIHFPINPERVTVQTGTKLHTFEVITLGDVALPRGRELDRVEFEGLLPGRARSNTTMVKCWRAPNEIVKEIEGWKNGGEKLRLLITETTINLDVYVDSFRPDWSGGHGDAGDSIILVQARELIVPVHEVLEIEPEPQPAAPRPAPPTPKTYTVKSGDSLWAIAKRALGDGSRWPEVYEANKGVIGPNPNLIYPGQSFRIP